MPTFDPNHPWRAARTPCPRPRPLPPTESQCPDIWNVTVLRLFNCPGIVTPMRPMSTPTELGAAIRSSRQTLGMTQAQVARKAGVAQG